MSDLFLLRKLFARFAHASDAELIALTDGELSDRKRYQLLRHLNRCKSCLRRSELIIENVRKLSQLNSSRIGDLSFENRISQNLISSMRAWQAAHSSPIGAEDAVIDAPISAEEASKDIEAVIGVYLGKKAAAAYCRVENNENDVEHGSLSDAESTLRVLLGNKPASAIESKISRIISRIPETHKG